MVELYPRPGGDVNQGDLGKNMGRRRLRGHEPKLQVIDDAIHHGMLREEGASGKEEQPLKRGPTSSAPAG